MLRAHFCFLIPSPARTLPGILNSFERVYCRCTSLRGEFLMSLPILLSLVTSQRHTGYIENYVIASCLRSLSSVDNKMELESQYLWGLSWDKLTELPLYISTLFLTLIGGPGSLTCIFIPSVTFFSIKTSGRSRISASWLVSHFK